jgi:hypothetical protein
MTLGNMRATIYLAKACAGLPLPVLLVILDHALGNVYCGPVLRHLAELGSLRPRWPSMVRERSGAATGGAAYTNVSYGYAQNNIAGAAVG